MCENENQAQIETVLLGSRLRRDKHVNDWMVDRLTDGVQRESSPGNGDSMSGNHKNNHKNASAGCHDMLGRGKHIG